MRCFDCGAVSPVMVVFNTDDDLALCIHCYRHKERDHAEIARDGAQEPGPSVRAAQAEKDAEFRRLERERRLLGPATELLADEGLAGVLGPMARVLDMLGNYCAETDAKAAEARDLARSVGERELQPSRPVGERDQSLCAICNRNGIFSFRVRGREFAICGDCRQAIAWPSSAKT